MSQLKRVTVLLKKNVIPQVLLLFCILYTGEHIQAQCASNVPVVNVDLSSSTDALWTSNPLQRQGLCCSSGSGDACIQFNVTLHPESKGIILDVCGGPALTGSPIYQSTCTDDTPIGQEMCLIGPGPHTITFCDPNPQVNQYCISSIAPPHAGPDIWLNENCSNTLTSENFIESTITWNSVFPGGFSVFNYLLDCNSECANTTISSDSGLPEFVDYQVCGTSANTCDNSMVCDTVRVYFGTGISILSNPSPPRICYGEDSTTFSVFASGGYGPYGYQWSHGTSGQEITVAEGSYEVTIVDSTGCETANATFPITTYTQPTIADAGLDTSYCSSEAPFPLDGVLNGASGSYWWGGNGSFSNSINQSTNGYTPSAAEVSNGVVQLNLTALGPPGCGADTSSIIIDIHHFNGLVNTNHSHVQCNGHQDGVIQLEVEGADAPYTTYWPYNSLSAGDTSAITGLPPGFYDAIVSGNSGCDTTVTTEIIQAPFFFISDLSIEGPSCTGVQDAWASVQVSGGLPDYDLLWFSEFWPDDIIGDSIFNLLPGNYLVQCVDSLGCTLESPFTITDPPPLEASVQISDVLCYEAEDGLLTFTADGGTTPYHYFVETTHSTNNVFTNLSEGFYPVSVEDENGCNWDTTIQILQPPPLVLTQVLGGSICLGEDLQITAYSQGGTGDVEYIWNQGIGTGNPVVVSPPVSTDYLVYAQDENNCNSEIDTASVRVFRLDPDSLNAFSINNICPGEDALIQIDHSQTYGSFSYEWELPAIGTGPHIVSPDSSSHFLVTVTDQCGNTLQDSAYVLVHPNPVYSLPDTIATGCEVVNADFDNGISDSEYSYQWDFGDGASSTQSDPTHQYNQVGIYNVGLEVSTSFGCTSFFNGTHIVQVYPPIESSIIASPVVSNMSDPTIDFSDLTEGASLWQWSLGDGGYASDSTFTYTYLEPGYYNVNLLASSAHGCVDNATIQILIEANGELEIPNAFTPIQSSEGNGNYVPGSLDNDIFYVFSEYVTDFHMQIFNRWGELVFESFDIRTGWDGSYLGKPSQQDVYIYQVKVRWQDGKEAIRTGDVTLFR